MNILVAYSSSSMMTPTTVDYISAFGDYSKYNVQYLNVTHTDKLIVDLTGYSAVIVTYTARLCFPDYVSPDFITLLINYAGIKILTVQDEYDNTNLLRDAIREIGFDLVLTCVPEEHIDYVYPKTDFNHTEFRNVLTGYVPERMSEKMNTPMPLQERPITVAYRGRDISRKYGQLGRDKFEIGEKFKSICSERGITHDIAMDENSRIYGDAWFDFIASSRAMLGSESGSNVFDFTGEIEALCSKYSEASSEEREQLSKLLNERESEISMGQVSPRVFEAIALKTPLILYTGYYSGIIQPDEHYIELKKDFSNIKQVLEKLNDFKYLNRLVDRAHKDIIESGLFSYERFIKNIDEYLEENLPNNAQILVQHTSGYPVPGFSREENEIISSPTKKPRMFSDFRIDILEKENQGYFAEIKRLNRVFPEEIDRLNRVYTDEIDRLNKVYKEEINRLNGGDSSIVRNSLGRLIKLCLVVLRKLKAGWKRRCENQ